MFADVGGIPAVVQTGGRDYGHDGGYGMMGAWWIFALVIIFFALVFWGRRDEHKGGGFDQLFGLAALGNMKKDHQEPAQAAAYVELNGRMNELSRQIQHNDDIAAWRDIKNTQCGTENLINNNTFNLSGQIQQAKFDQLLGAKDIEGKQAVGIERVIESNNLNTRAIIDAIRGDTIDRLKDELAKERLAASQFRQDLLIQQSSGHVIDTLTRRHGLPPCPPYGEPYVAAC
jgi:hypothetical protein